MLARYKVAAVVALLLASATADTPAVSGQEHPHAFPRTGVTKIHETDRLIVWDVNWLNSVSQPIHRHQYDMASIYMRWGAVQITQPDGTKGTVGGPFPVPSPYFQRKGVTHSEQGVGGLGPERMAITVDLKDGVTVPPLTLKPDAIAAYPRVGALAVTNNERVVTWEYTWLPKRVVPMHVHDKDSVVVFVESGTILSRTEDGKEELYSVAFKDVRVIPRGLVHSEEAIAGAPKAFIIELK